MISKYPNFRHSVPVNRAARWYLNLRNSRLKKLIFTATTGRSGTMSLTSVFSAIPGCQAVHEPYPRMHGPWLHAASYGETDEVRRYYERVKAIQIRYAAIGARYYIESNHLFIKTFIEHAVRDFGDRVEVIHLVRPAMEVAKSIYYLQNWPGTEMGNEWWLDYHAPSNLMQIADLLDGDGEFSHPFYKALWYWYETEARVQYWQEKLPNIRFHHFETHWINDYRRMICLLDDLDITYDREQLMTAVGVRKNDKEKKKLLVSSRQLPANSGPRRAIGRSLDDGDAQRLNERFKEALTSRRLWDKLPYHIASPQLN